MAAETVSIHPVAQPISDAQLNKHYFRKHGPKATYGQGQGSRADLRRMSKRGFADRFTPCESDISTNKRSYPSCDAPTCYILTERVTPSRESGLTQAGEIKGY
jgi:hypothetical protein